ncbi:MAG: tRNA (N6-isopentenyl adenosine(37)-C2)-methylthiotransferase MiaB [Desulfovibrio sp.]|jgi:tRNA-2-methylthio-N6-dimethylallyladenosine synthase|nr:tRNA (N6-isopentenyl adenosine(37)-C2)-methylthiotransferase MiaB [Desulfovibrio sp.]
MDLISPTFHIQTFGCQMNAADSDWLARALSDSGLLEASFAEAGIYILNTCSVRDKPEQKLYSELGRIAHYCKTNKKKAVVCVGGCVAQQAGVKLAARFPQVRLVFGSDGIAEAPQAIARLAADPTLRISLLGFTEKYQERLEPHRLAKFEDSKKTAVQPCAFVNIMQGCDNFCAYCIVPFVRGRQKSRAPEAILHECRTLTANGTREITLLGQNVNAYGLDGDGLSFADLLRKISALPDLLRLRFVTSHPKDLAVEVIEQFADNPKLCPRLHLPLQSGSDKILQAMNRRYDMNQYMNLVKNLRTARPDIALTTDLIVGFPGESEADFQATLHVMDEIKYAAAFSFAYSDRPGAAAVSLPDKISREKALERLAILQNMQNQYSGILLQSMRGKESVILLEGKSHMETLLPGEDADRKKNPKAKQSLITPKSESAKNAQSPSTGSCESWHGRTPHGFIVNVMLDTGLDAPFPGNKATKKEGVMKSTSEGMMRGAMLPVRIEAAAKHSLKGVQTAAPW